MLTLAGRFLEDLANSLDTFLLLSKMTSTDISREDLLLLLASIGIVFSKDAKLPIGELNKRLANALDASQQNDEFIDTTPLDPFEFPNWSGKSISIATAA